MAALILAPIIGGLYLAVETDQRHPILLLYIGAAVVTILALLAPFLAAVNHAAQVIGGAS